MSEKFLPSSPEKKPSNYDDVMHRLVRSPIIAGLATAAIACSPTKKEVNKMEHAGIVQWIDGKEEDFFCKHENGEYTQKERLERTKTLPNGEQIFEDVGLKFYKVKAGDSISKIRAALAKYPEFSYLSDQKLKLQSFNIPASELKAGMWIPIPLKNDERHLTDEQFVIYAKEALEELKSDKKYGETVEAILERKGMTEEKLVASMLAIAKQESGGLPIGLYELHRWEGKGSHNEFSFSMFHVLMAGPGLIARRNLDMTEGQTYHPVNAVKLLVGFLAEKAKEPEPDIDITKFFPFSEETVKKFATFYNGRGWVINNRSYPKNILNFYKKGLEIID